MIWGIDMFGIYETAMNEFVVAKYSLDGTCVFRGTESDCDNFKARLDAEYLRHYCALDEIYDEMDVLER